MKTIYIEVPTPAGMVVVITRDSWMWVVKRPHTSIMPKDRSLVDKLGVVVFWSTSDPKDLKWFHENMVMVVMTRGLPRLRAAMEEARSNGNRTEAFDGVIPETFHEFIEGVEG